jgi:hypothetical protein
VRVENFPSHLKFKVVRVTLVAFAIISAVDWTFDEALDGFDQTIQFHQP